jgi:hypothetical protein
VVVPALVSMNASVHSQPGASRPAESTTGGT